MCERERGVDVTWVQTPFVGQTLSFFSAQVNYYRFHEFVLKKPIHMREMVIFSCEKVQQHLYPAFGQDRFFSVD